MLYDSSSRYGVCCFPATINSINGITGKVLHEGDGDAACFADAIQQFSCIFGNFWFAVLLVFIFTVLLVFFSRNGISRLTRHLKLAALVLWAAGVALYMYGFNEEGSVKNNSLVLFLRASLSSMEMFVSHSDLIEVKKELHHEAMYMVPFSVVHFCAVLVSALFIIRLLGLRFVSWFKLLSWRVFHLFIKNKPCFVFFGIECNGILLAESIKRKYGENCRIIFINLPDDRHTHADSRLTFGHIFHSSGERASVYADNIERMGALMFNAGKRVSEVSDSNAGIIGDNTTVFDIFSRLGLSVPLIRSFDFLIGRFAERGKVEFFFLSDNETENISSVLALKALDKDSNPDTCKNFRCYCHVRRKSSNMALLRRGGLKNRIYPVDSSLLSVMKLMKDVANHPVSFVDIDKDRAVAKTGYTGMVVGFNETGREAFKFLYEFSSFVCDDSGTENVKTIHVVDEHLDSMKAEFLNNAPALKDKSRETVEWWENMSTHSEAFWEKLRLVIDGLNHVVIAVGDDEEGVALACDMYEFAYRYRKDLDRFKIFVRIRDGKISDHMHKVADIIVPFGTDRDVFEYETMSVDVLEMQAIRFFYNYERKRIENMKSVEVPNCTEELKNMAKGDMKGAGDENRIERIRSEIEGMEREIEKFEEIDGDAFKPDDEKGAELWLHRRLYKLVDGDYARRDKKEDDIEVTYMEEQDKSNVWHALTKRALSRYRDFGMVASDPVLLANMNYCEHLRWNAKMELLGFARGEKKDLRKRLHPCIVDCKTLSEKFGYTIPFDQTMVEVSFGDMTNIEKQNLS